MLKANESGLGWSLEICRHENYKRQTGKKVLWGVFCWGFFFQFLRVHFRELHINGAFRVCRS